MTNKRDDIYIQWDMKMNKIIDWLKDNVEMILVGIVFTLLSIVGLALILRSVLFIT